MLKRGFAREAENDILTRRRLAQDEWRVMSHGADAPCLAGPP